MLEAVEVQLPGSTREAVRQQVALTFQPPYETPITVAVNGALMSSAWFFLLSAWRDKVFHLARNPGLRIGAGGVDVLGRTVDQRPRDQRDSVVAALDDPVMLRRLLQAKNIVLWLMVTPLCALVAIINGLVNHSLLSTFYTVVAIGVIPFGVLAISAWVGIVLPYHPMPLRYRWEHLSAGRGCWCGAHPGRDAVPPRSDAGHPDARAVAPRVGFTSPHGLSPEVAGS